MEKFKNVIVGILVLSATILTTIICIKAINWLACNIGVINMARIIIGIPISIFVYKFLGFVGDVIRTIYNNKKKKNESK